MGPTSTAIDPAALSRRLLLLTALRTAVITALLVITTALSLWDREGLAAPVAQWLFGIALGSYALILGCAIAIRFQAPVTRVAYAQMIGDILVALAVVYLTGGASSVFVFMFPLAVVSASVLLFRAGAFVAATASALAFVAISFLINTRALPPAARQLSAPPLSTADLAISIVANVCAFYLTAVLASYLAEQLRSTGLRLSQREAEYAVLEGLHSWIVESVSSGIATADADGGLTYLNPAGEEVLQRRFHDVQGAPIAEVFGTALAPGRSPRGELRLKIPGGETRIIGYSVSTLQRGGPGSVIAFQDLTQIRTMEETVRRAEHLSAMGRMAAGLAHEVRNPVGAMVGALGLLSSAPGAEDERRLLDILRREADRLNRLVADFLAFARPAPAKLAALELEPFIREVVAVFSHDPKTGAIRIETSLAAVSVLGDPEVLRRAMLNLLINAVHAMAGRDGRIAVRVAAEDEAAIIEVADDGIGIAEENLPRIFDPFFSTKEQGTGLGLALVHAGVEAMGGSVSVKSRPGQGTTFTLRLPRLKSASPSARRAAVS